MCTTLSPVGSKRPKCFLVIALAMLAILSIAAVSKVFHVKLNDTPSMPIGFYRRIDNLPVRRYDRVSACLPKPVAIEALQRGYLYKGPCPGGALPVLKEVIALPGDSVELTDNAIIVNGKTYPAPYASHDRQGLPNQKFVQNGIYSPTHVYWLYGAHTPIKSWDSRYYGGVQKSAIRGIYKPLLTF